MSSVMGNVMCNFNNGWMRDKFLGGEMTFSQDNMSAVEEMMKHLTPHLETVFQSVSGAVEQTSDADFAQNIGETLSTMVAANIGNLPFNSTPNESMEADLIPPADKKFRGGG